MRYWIIADPITGMCAYAMRDSRGRKVPGGILGNRGGTIVRGGRGAYGPCHTRRCRAHTLREMRDLCARNPDDRDEGTSRT